MARIQQFFRRMIAVADRDCSQCGDTVDEGSIYFKDKRADAWCGSCVDYERQKE